MVTKKIKRIQKKLLNYDLEYINLGLFNGYRFFYNIYMKWLWIYNRLKNCLFILNPNNSIEFLTMNYQGQLKSQL